LYRYEIWKDIPGMCGYQASSLGRVKSIPRIIIRSDKKKQTFKGRLLKFENKINGAGYYGVSIGHRNSQMVHRLVALAFIPNPDNKKQVNHKNFNKLDNRVSNLEWMNPSENIQHMMKAGRLDDHRKWMSKTVRGTGNIKCKLTEKQVASIKDLYKRGMYQKDIAVIFKVTQATISGITRGSTWKHLA